RHRRELRGAAVAAAPGPAAAAIRRPRRIQPQNECGGHPRRPLVPGRRADPAAEPRGQPPAPRRPPRPADPRQELAQLRPVARRARRAATGPLPVPRLAQLRPVARPARRAAGGPLPVPRLAQRGARRRPGASRGRAGARARGLRRPPADRRLVQGQLPLRGFPAGRPPGHLAGGGARGPLGAVRPVRPGRPGHAAGRPLAATRLATRRTRPGPAAPPAALAPARLARQRQPPAHRHRLGGGRPRPPVPPPPRPPGQPGGPGQLVRGRPVGRVAAAQPPPVAQAPAPPGGTPVPGRLPAEGTALRASRCPRDSEGRGRLARAQTRPVRADRRTPMIPRSRKRLFGLYAIALAMLVVLGGRLWYLQVLDTAQYKSLAQVNQTRTIVVPAVRGMITDDTGQALVTNQTSMTVSVNMMQLSQTTTDGGKAVLARLAPLLHLPAKTLAQKVRLCTRGVPQPCWTGSPYQPIPVAQHVSATIALQIMEEPKLFPGVTAQLSPVVDYPMPNGANPSQVLGYLQPITQAEMARQHIPETGFADDDLVGQSGLEAQYNAALTGKPGTKVVSVNAAGDVLGAVGGTPAKTGDTLVTSLNA